MSKTAARSVLGVLPMLEEDARERMAAGVNQYSSPSQIIDRGTNGRAAEQAAAPYSFHLLPANRRSAGCLGSTAAHFDTCAGCLSGSGPAIAT